MTHQKRPWIQWTLFAMLVVAGTSTLAIRVADAAHGFSDRTLRGRFFINLIEIRQEPAGVDFCDITAVFRFDGRGSAVGESTRKCSLTGTVTGSGSFVYAVAPDGQFLLTEAGGSSPIHGQIVHNGRLLLFDGTTATSPQVLVQNGTGARRR